MLELAGFGASAAPPAASSSGPSTCSTSASPAPPPAGPPPGSSSVVALRPGSGQLESATDLFTAGGVSKDGTVAYSSLTYKVISAELTDATCDALAAQPETGPSEIIGVLVAAMVLVITFGSLLAAGLPLLTAIIGVGIGVSMIAALAPAATIPHG